MEESFGAFGLGALRMVQAKGTPEILFQTVVKVLRKTSLRDKKECLPSPTYSLADKVKINLSLAGRCDTMKENSVHCPELMSDGG